VEYLKIWWGDSNAKSFDGSGFDSNSAKI